jgi:hypothetical protein
MGGGPYFFCAHRTSQHGDDKEFDDEPEDEEPPVPEPVVEAKKGLTKADKVLYKAIHLLEQNRNPNAIHRNWVVLHQICSYR